jgi:hypothetical protein
LFYWEEEITRWNLLDCEKQNIVRALQSVDEGPWKEQLELSLQAVEANMALAPSKRARPDDEPPFYNPGSTAGGSATNTPPPSMARWNSAPEAETSAAVEDSR